MSETVRGGINSIDVGQIEGAKALGMGYVPMMIYIILPQTFKIIAPQIGNTFVANITYIFADPTVGKFFTHSYQNPKSA